MGYKTKVTGVNSKATLTAFLKNHLSYTDLEYGENFKNSNITLGEVTYNSSNPSTSTDTLTINKNEWSTSITNKTTFEDYLINTLELDVNVMTQKSAIYVSNYFGGGIRLGDGSDYYYNRLLGNFNGYFGSQGGRNLTNVNQYASVSLTYLHGSADLNTRSFKLVATLVVWQTWWDGSKGSKEITVSLVFK